MYDQNTLELIREAPQFGDLDLEQLPKQLTDGYTQVISARLRLREIQQNTRELNNLADLLKKTITIALTYEAYVVLLSERQNRSAAAFIAASAHQLSFQIKSILPRIEDEPRVLISSSGIDPRISAALLYFIAGYTADAAEIVKKMVFDNSDTPTAGLILALQRLLTGKIVNDELPPYYPDAEAWGDKAASDALWGLIHKGVNYLLEGLTNQPSDVKGSFQQAMEIFDRVIELSMMEEEITSDNFVLPLKSGNG